MSLFPEQVLREAATWLAGHERALFEDRIVATGPERVRLYFGRILDGLRGAADRCAREQSDHHQIGTSVPCGMGSDGVLGAATVIVRPDRVYGYLPDDGRRRRPSFIWPPELARRMRAIWAAREALGRSSDEDAR